MSADTDPRVTTVNVHDVRAEHVHVESDGDVSWLSFGRVVALFGTLDELAAIGREIVRQAEDGAA